MTIQAVSVPKRPDTPSAEDYVQMLHRTIERLILLYNALEGDDDERGGEAQQSVSDDIKLLERLRDGLLIGVMWQQTETLH